MIQINSICLSYGSQKIFDHISCTLDQYDRIGLVGRNGSGKSTFLKAIIEPKILDGGSISIIKGKKIAYMPQDVVLQSPKSILQEALSAFADIYALKEEIHAIELLLEKNSADLDTLERYAELQASLASAQENKIEAQTKKLLMGLGFTELQFDEPVSSLSVGWKMRVVLAKLLLQNADFYLFDEPTNHLDLIAKEWFLDFLQKSSFGFLLVCHERYFLDELCTKILDLERGTGKMYSGNYSDFEIQKEHDQRLLETAYAQQQREIKQKTATIERFRAKASKAAMAQSMMKSLEKIERIELPPNQKNVSFNFPVPEQPGKIVLTVKDVSQQFGDKKIFEHVSCEIERGQKVSIIAPNGGGKTTLFNLMVGKLPLQHGTINFGHNVKHAIFNQDQNSALDGSASVIENIRARCPKKTEQVMRSFLGAFLFGSEEVKKKVSVLSGGEKNRVGMVSVLLQDANLLLLDEPTNHLDIQSKEILLKALQEYKGTIIFVSHDRDFVNSLATHIIDLTPNGAHTYVGNYDAYIFQKKNIANLKESPKKEAVETKNEGADSSKNLFELRKQSKRLESKIQKLEELIEKLGLKFADFTFGSTDYIRTQKELHNRKQELASCLLEWEQVQKQLL